MDSGLRQRSNSGPQGEPAAVRARVLQLGRPVFSFQGQAPVTVEAALRAAGIDPGNLDIRVNGKAASPSDLLADGDLVTAIPLIRGGGSRRRAAARATTAGRPCSAPASRTQLLGELVRPESG